jgi:hypothetical protein
MTGKRRYEIIIISVHFHKVKEERKKGRESRGDLEHGPISSSA